MSARKKRPVLYELVGKSKRNRGWTASGSSAPQSQPQQPTPPAPPAEPPAPQHPPTPRPQPTVTKRADRVQFSLSQMQLIIIGVALLIVLIAVFQAGRRSALGPSDNPTTAEDVLGSGSPNASVPSAGALDTGHRPAGSANIRTPITGQQSPPPPASQTEPQRPQRSEPRVTFEPGKSYVIVQHFSSRRVGARAAEAARQYLESHGISCVVRPGKGDLELIAIEAFDVQQDSAAAARAEKRRAEALMKRIRELGEDYNLQAGYSFEGCYLRPW